MSNTFPKTPDDLEDSELLLLFAKQMRRGLGKLEPLHQHLLEQSSALQDRIEFQKIKEISDSLLVSTLALMDLLEKDQSSKEEIPFSLRTSLGKTIQFYSHVFSENQGSFDFVIPPHIPDTLLGSPAQIKRIVSLFFSQGLACKGQVHGTIEEEKTQNDSLHFLLHLNGASSEFKLDSFSLENFLYQKLVKKNGGKYWSESSPNGLTLHLELPVKIDSLEEEPEQKRFNLSGKKLLVIDSPSASLQMLSKLIESWKIEVHYTAVPEAARQLLSQFSKDGTPFDFVIVEKDLLGQNAFEWLLDKSGDRKNTHFILVTSSPERGDAALCIQHGIQAYLTQPLHGIELWEMLQHLLNQGKEAASLLTRHVLIEQDRHFKILVWDPREENRDKFVQLKKQGHAIHELKDSKEIFSRLRQTSYDLILLNLESIEEKFKISDLREINKNQRIPIIGLSKKSSSLSKDEGFDALISSPLKDEDLFNLLGQSS